MKLLFLRFFILVNSLIIAQTKDGIAIKIFVKDICQQKNIKRAKVTLEGYKQPIIIANYNKKEKCYFFNSIPNRYTTVFVNHKDYDEAGFKLIDSIPKKINIELNCKGSVLETYTTYKEIPYKVKGTTNTYGYEQRADKKSISVSTRDEYKIFISLKNSVKMSYKEVRKKIDSIVNPLGFEYIENLQPKVYFMNIFQYCNQNLKEDCVNDFFARPIATNINEDLLIKEALKEGYFNSSSDFNSNGIDKYIFFGMDDSLNMINWNKNCYILPYRKKDYNKVRVLNDDIVETIKNKTNILSFFGLYYKKFEMEEQLDFKAKDENLNYTGKMDCKFLSSFDDKLLNFQFINHTPEEISRTFYLDYYLKKTYVNKYGLYNDMTGDRYRFLHEYSLKKSNADDPIFKNYRNKGLFFNTSLVLVNY